MRAPPNEETATAGQSEVSGAFERLQWGSAPNPYHDLGTDLFVWPRDERRFDPGLLVLVQVKAGASYFATPELDDDESIIGWWFSEDRAHFDFWLGHGLPHLIVLYDLETRTAHWAHITAEAVVSTGKRAKILVPSASIVDAAHREALLKVAATLRPGVAWEGSAWNGAESLSPRDLLRHALIVPRLVAPHRNAGHELPIAPEQAVALLVQGRVRDVERFAFKHGEVPALADAAKSTEWLWRFVGALHHRLTTGEAAQLLLTAEDAPNPWTRSAATVAAAANLVEESRADEAIELLEAALARDDATPVDHAWLTAQYARACAELGRVDDARAAAVGVQRVRATHPGDVTATAIAGAAAALLFNTSTWEQANVSETVTGMDTMATWWRAQTVSSGLTAVAERTFKAWTRGTSVTVGGEDIANNHLLAASLTASYVGDHGNWMHLTGLIGQDALLRVERTASPEEAARALDSLRLSGNVDELTTAVRRLMMDGPSAAVSIASLEINLAACTRTTAPANLALLQHGGDVLDIPTADGSVDWLLATLDDGTAFISRTAPSYLVATRLIDTLASAAPAASPAQQQAVIDYLLALPAQGEVLGTSWWRVVSALPDDIWDEQSRRTAGTRAEMHDPVLRFALLGISARQDAAARDRLLEAANTGSLDALAELGDVEALPIETVIKSITRLAELIGQQVTQARAGAVGFGGHDIGRTLAVLNACFPESANWSPLFELLDEPAILGGHKRGALAFLASSSERIPADIRPRLAETALTIIGQQAPAHPLMFGEERDAAGEASDLAAVLGALDDDAIADRLVSLLAEDTDHRRSAVRVAHRLGRSEDVGVLVALSQDPEPRLRADAAAGLAALVATARGGPIALTGLRRRLADPGTWVPINVAVTLAAQKARTQTADEILDGLLSHRSARVRAIAATRRPP